MTTHSDNIYYTLNDTVKSSWKSPTLSSPTLSAGNYYEGRMNYSQCSEMISGITRRPIYFEQADRCSSGSKTGKSVWVSLPVQTPLTTRASTCAVNTGRLIYKPGYSHDTWDQPFGSRTAPTEIRPWRGCALITAPISGRLLVFVFRVSHGCSYWIAGTDAGSVWSNTNGGDNGASRLAGNHRSGPILRLHALKTTKSTDDDNNTISILV